MNDHVRGRVDVGRIDLMRNFSFFEVDETEADRVVKAMNQSKWNGRKVTVEVAGTESDDRPQERKRKDNASKGKKNAGKAAEAPKATKKNKPSREERGYTKPRGKKDDWKQFFQHNNDDFRDPEPDFSEEGWAKRSKKKKK